MSVKLIEHSISCPGDINIKDFEQDYIMIKDKTLKQRGEIDLESFFKSIPEDIDVIILSSFNEKCKNLEQLGSVKNEYTLFKSVSPGSVNAFVFKNSKAEKLQEKINSSKEEKLSYKVQNLIINEQIKAAFVWPQVLYNPTEEFLHICREEREYFINPNISEFSFYWFILTLFISIIFVYYIVDKIPKDRFFYIAKK